tara:strand:- start:38 stop:583 length:546 start_codon:yes stop_codon:yes gene_type:complete
VIKSRIRKKILKLREKKKLEKKDLNPSILISILKKEFKNSFTVGGYFPVNCEISDLEILRELIKKKIKVSLPVIGKNKNMNFHYWSFNEPLAINHYGIPEPLKSKIVIPDVLLVPIVAFDHKLFRLGYGGGFYDRYIEKVQKKNKLFTIGLAYNFQKINKVPVNKYDKKLNIILTEKNILK